MKMEIMERGGKRFVVLPIKEFEHLCEDSEMLDDIRAYDEAKSRSEESFPAAVLNSLLADEQPVRVFRRFRGMTQQQLAKRAKIARAYLAEIETGKKQGSVTVLKALAKALAVELGDIA